MRSTITTILATVALIFSASTAAAGGLDDHSYDDVDFAGVLSVALGAAFGSQYTIQDVSVDTDAGVAISVSGGVQPSRFVQWHIVDIDYARSGFEGVMPAGFCDNIDCSFSLLNIGTSVRAGLFDKKRKIQPFILGGVSGARTSAADGASWNLGWKAGAGAMYAFDNDMKVGARYEYNSTSSEASMVETLSSHRILVELQFVGY